MKAEILKCLKEAQDYLSGQELCDRFHVSRTAVWKVIHSLQEEGYEIRAVRNRGYRLMAGADSVSEAELKSVITTSWAGRNLACFEETDSTNIQARRLAEQGAAHGTLVVAESQTAGRGRRGKGWVSRPGSGVWMSMVLRPQIDPSRASMVTLVAALSVASGIGEVTGVQTQIKWPNDLVYGGRKICGILTEMSSEADSIRYIVTGIGINVNMDSFPADIGSIAVSLKMILGEPVRRAILVNAVLRAFEHYYEIYEKTADMSFLLEEYNQRLANLGKEVRVLSPGKEYEGKALGIDDMGELLVETGDGQVRRVFSGEVSVRGIYGYV